MTRIVTPGPYDIDELLPPYPALSPEGIRHADETVAFLELLPQSKGRKWYGKPLSLIHWQRRFVRELFGRRDPATGLRQYRTCFIFIPKKQGKSTLAAGLILKLLLADGEPGAECYGAAYDKEQARIVYKVAKAMVEQEEELAKRCHIVEHKSLIEFPETRSEYYALAHDTEGSHGFNIHGLVVDEFHTWKDGELFQTLDYGTASRDQPLTVIITTAGLFDPQSPCYKLYTYACQVRDGLIDDPTFLPVIFEAPDEDVDGKPTDWADPMMWYRANPSLGITVPESYLATKARKAEHVSTEILSFRRLHLNQWPEQLKGWLSMSHWKQCGELSYSEDDFRGRRAWIGLDVGDTQDLTALGIVIPLDDGTLALAIRVFCPETTIARRSKRDKVPYELWARAGFLTKTSGDVTDYGAIRAEIHRLAGFYEVQEICPDPWNALQLSSELIEDGFRVVKIPQSTAHINYPAKELEKRVKAVEIRHGNNPVLTWCAANATVRMDANGNIKPDKAHSKERIDPVTALVNGMARALAGQVSTVPWLVVAG